MAGVALDGRDPRQKVVAKVPRIIHL